jgi:hypothetical protein
MVISYNVSKQFQDFTDNEIAYTNANKEERLKHVNSGDTHHDEVIPLEVLYDNENGKVKRYFTTLEAAESYKATVIANAQKYNVGLKSVDIFDNDKDPDIIL